MKFMRNISKYHFSDGRFLLNSIMDIHYSAAEGGGGPKSDGCICERRSGNLKFLICALYVSKLS